MLIPMYGIALIGSLFLLWWSGDGVVRYSLATSHILGISGLFIGFALIAFATGLPELVVAIMSTVSGASQMSAGDIIGSNFIDVSLVLGLPALMIRSLHVPKEQFRHLIILLFTITLLMAIIFSLGSLTRVHGLCLVIGYLAAIWWLWRTRQTTIIARDHAEIQQEKIEQQEHLTSKRALLIKLSAMLILLIAASYGAVYAALEIAKYYHISTTLIGATIFALGTSLPELTLSMHAVRKREHDLALGNSFGSVLAQGSFILGMLAMMSPDPIRLDPLRKIAPYMFLAYGIIGYGMIRRNKITKIDGLILTLLYGVFIAVEYFFLRKTIG